MNMEYLKELSLELKDCYGVHLGADMDMIQFQRKKENNEEKTIMLNNADIFINWML